MLLCLGGAQRTSQNTLLVLTEFYTKIFYLNHFFKVFKESYLTLKVKLHPVVIYYIKSFGSVR